MSYCGTCGTFYFPECVRRADGGCMPAVNPYELMIVKQQAMIAAANLVGIGATIGRDGDPEALNTVANAIAALDKIISQPD